MKNSKKLGRTRAGGAKASRVRSFRAELDLIVARYETRTGVGFPQNLGRPEVKERVEEDPAFRAALAEVHKAAEYWLHGQA